MKKMTMKERMKKVMINRPETHSEIAYRIIKKYSICVTRLEQKGDSNPVKTIKGLVSSVISHDKTGMFITEIINGRNYYSLTSNQKLKNVCLDIPNLEMETTPEHELKLEMENAPEVYSELEMEKRSIIEEFSTDETMTPEIRQMSLYLISTPTLDDALIMFRVNHGGTLLYGQGIINEIMSVFL